MEKRINDLLKKSASRKEIIEDFTKIIKNAEDWNLLKKYIDNNLEKYLYLEDSYILSVLCEYSTPTHYKVAKKVVKRRNSYFLKLQILDFILTFFDGQKHLSDFRKINEIAANNINIFVVFQARLNMLCIKQEGIGYFLQNGNYPVGAFYYRLINSLENSVRLKEVFREYLEIVLKNIKNNSSLHSNQKLELINRIEEL